MTSLSKTLIGAALVRQRLGFFGNDRLGRGRLHRQHLLARHRKIRLSAGCPCDLHEDTWKPGPSITFREHTGRGYWQAKPGKNGDRRAANRHWSVWNKNGATDGRAVLLFVTTPSKIATRLVEQSAPDDANEVGPNFALWNRELYLLHRSSLLSSSLTD